MSQKSNARRAVISSCIALFANMGMNSTFTVFLMTLIAKWPEAAPVMLLPITVGCAMSFVCSSFLMGPLMKKLSPRTIFLVCAVLGALYCGCYAFAGSYTVLIVASVFGGLVLSLGTHAMGVNAITPYFGEFGTRTGITIGAVLASASVGAAVFSFSPGLIDITGSLLFGYAFHDPTAVWFAVICSILCVSGAMILNICPVITPALFGAKEMNRINAVYSGGVFWGAAAVAAQILNFVITENVNGEVVPAHYDRGFLLAVVFGVAGMICLFASLALNPMKKKS